jgi:hypothetical protein
MRVARVARVARIVIFRVVRRITGLLWVECSTCLLWIQTRLVVKRTKHGAYEIRLHGG